MTAMAAIQTAGIAGGGALVAGALANVTLDIVHAGNERGRSTAPTEYVAGAATLGAAGTAGLAAAIGLETIAPRFGTAGRVAIGTAVGATLLGAAVAGWAGLEAIDRS